MILEIQPCKIIRRHYCCLGDDDKGSDMNDQSAVPWRSQFFVFRFGVEMLLKILNGTIDFFFKSVVGNQRHTQRMFKSWSFKSVSIHTENIQILIIQTCFNSHIECSKYLRLPGPASNDLLRECSHSCVFESVVYLPLIRMCSNISSYFLLAQLWDTVIDTEWPHPL